MSSLFSLSTWRYRPLETAIVLTFFCLGSIAGCGSGDPLGRLPIAGTVQWEGSPLKTGTIRFEPFDTQPGDKRTAAGATIRDGKFALSSTEGVPPGKYSVAITASEDTSGPTSSDPVEAMSQVSKQPVPKQLIPERYNRRTELVVEVKPNGPNMFPFDLTEKPPANTLNKK